MTTQLIRTKGTQLPLVSAPPSVQCEVCVIIPVKDEAQVLECTLSALCNQTTLSGRPLNPLRYEVVLLANNCTDSSATIARRFAGNHPRMVLHVVEARFPPRDAYVGYARKLLMDEAYKRLIGLGRPRGVIASTDGDTQVSSTWIAATLQEISEGADAVGGRIVTDRVSRSQLCDRAKSFFLREVGYRSLVAELEHYLDPNPYDPLPRHYQHYGASLAVTAEAYAVAGGMPPVRTPEDEAFYQSLVRMDAKFRHSPSVKVTTSARASGRSPVGLANQLREWTERADAAFEVEPVSVLVTRFSSRRKLRSLWQRILQGHVLNVAELEPLARNLGISAGNLLYEMNQHHTFGQLLEEVNSYQQNSCLIPWQRVDINTALAEIRQKISVVRRSVAS